MSETSKVLLERYGPRYRAYLTGVALLGMIGPVMTTTAINVALPDIMGSFGIGQDRAQWLSTGALAGMTVGMLLAAWVIDSLGPRRVFVGGLVIFAAAVITAGVSPNDGVLILARIVQGLIAGILQTLATASIFSIFPPERRGTAMGFFSITVILGPALGPIFAGMLIEHLNWRYVFFMALPFTAAGMLLGAIFMPEREPTDKRTHFDWLGFALVSVAMWTLLHGLSNGQREGWNSDHIVVTFVVAVSATAAFVFWELHTPQPLVALRLLRNPRFAGAACVSGVFGVGMFGSIYLIPLFTQIIQRFSAFDAGLVLVPGALILAVMMPLGGYLSDHVPPRTLIVPGLVVFAASIYLMTGMDANTSFWWIALCTLAGRIAQGMILPTLNVSALRAVSAPQVRQGAGLVNFSRQLGGAFGVNLLAITLDRQTARHGDALASMQTGDSGASAELLRTIERLLAQAGAPPELQAQGALHYFGRVLHEQAYTLAFRDSFAMIALAFIVALIPAWMMGRRPPR